MVVGGAAGKSVRKADLLTTVETTEQALEASELFFQYYRENANYLERTYDFVERLGIEKVRKETVYAPDDVAAGAARSAAQVEGALPRCLAGRDDAEARRRSSSPSRSDGQGAGMNERPLDSRHATATTSRCAKGAP